MTNIDLNNDELSDKYDDLVRDEFGIAYSDAISDQINALMAKQSFDPEPMEDRDGLAWDAWYDRNYVACMRQLLAQTFGIDIPAVKFEKGFHIQFNDLSMLNQDI